MPLDIQRLLNSDFFLDSDGDEFKAGLTLWAVAFHRVPASSLPNDERKLARLAGGYTPAEWQRIKQRSLRGWIECSDGLLYHPVVAEKALEAFLGRVKNKIGSSKTNAARWGKGRSPEDLESLKYSTEMAVKRLSAGPPYLAQRQDDVRTATRSPTAFGSQVRETVRETVRGIGKASESDDSARLNRASRKSNPLVSGDRDPQQVRESFSHEDWWRFLTSWIESRSWPPYLGPSPNEPSCEAPAELVTQARDLMAAGR